MNFMIAGPLGRFIRERFAWQATVPLAAVLWLAPYSLFPWHALTAATGYVTVWLGLLCLRIADDTASVPQDRLTHPERGLASGAIDAGSLLRAMWGLLAFIVLLNGKNPWIPLALILYYAACFYLKYRLPVVIRPFFSNLIFALLPVYAASASGEPPGASHLLLALFAWIAAVAHEYAHSVEEPEDRPLFPGYAHYLGARGTALVSLLGYLGATAAGLCFWLTAGRPLLFAVLLALTATQILLLELRLLRQPGAQTAKPFYIQGFLFFLLPEMGLIAQALMNFVLR